MALVTIVGNQSIASGRGTSVVTILDSGDQYGMQESLVNPSALGAEDPEFESQHSDSNTTSPGGIGNVF